MLRRLFFLTLLGIPLVALVRIEAASADDTPESVEQTKKEVLKVSADVDQAVARNDADALARNISDDLEYTNQFGELLTKAQWLANARSGTIKTVVMKHEVVHLHVFGDTVVLVGLSGTTFVYKGKVSDVPRRFTRVFVKQDGRWRMVAQHVTVVAE